MTVLERVFASSGPEIIIHTLELECSAWVVTPLSGTWTFS